MSSRLRQLRTIGLVLTGAVLTACAPKIVVAPEPRTAEEATLRAADREAPTGALIIKKPETGTAPEPRR